MRAIKKKKKKTASEIILESEEIAKTAQCGRMYSSPSCMVIVSKPGIEIGAEYVCVCVCVHVCVYMHRLASVHT